MSGKLENLSQNTSNIVEDESKSNEHILIEESTSTLPPASSKEAVSTTSSESVEPKLISTEQGENSLKSQEDTNVAECIEDRSASSDEASQNKEIGNVEPKFVSKEEENASKCQEDTNVAESIEERPTSADEASQSKVIENVEPELVSSEQEEKTLKPQNSINIAEGIGEETADADNSTQIRVTTSSLETVSDSTKTTVNKDPESSAKSKTLTATDKDDATFSASPSISTDGSVDLNYTDHMTYESDGSAIYKDPKTNYRYKWSTTENNWIPCDSNNTENIAGSANPYENDHYKWCSESQKWIPKVQTQTTETEHYKWDAERREWIPKAVITNTGTASDSDPANVAYDIDEDGQRIYTDKDGTVFFWDTTKNAWFPKIDEDFMAHYQMNYGFIDNTSASEEEKRRKAEEEEKLKELELQRMTEEAKAGAEATAKGNTDGASNTVSGVKRKAQEPPKWFDIDPEQNTKVYVSNLPLDITLDEFAELMSKCGMIMRDPQTQKFKLKLYAEADGQLKGDGLCDYIKVESVGLALHILDEYNLRGNKIRVQPAKFQMRGEYNPALKPKRKKKDKEKLQKMKEKLFDWRPEKMRGERSKNEKVVIIKNLFDPSIFEKEVQLILDYQNDLREECGKCGTVRKVVIYDRHPEGVAQINMADPEEADVVIQMMHGRYFGQRKLIAEHWDGKTKYKVVESEAEVQKRLSNWDQYLTQEENDRKNEAAKLNEVAVEKDALSKTSVEENETKNEDSINKNTLSARNGDVKDKPDEEQLEVCMASTESENNEIIEKEN